MDTAARKNLRSKSKKTLHNVDYIESSGFPAGVLPTKKDVIESMIYLLRPERAGKTIRDADTAAGICSYALQQQWRYCTVYTIQIQHIKKHVLTLYKKFNFFNQTRERDRNDNWKKRVIQFNIDMTQLFDIFCSNDHARLAQEKEFGVAMGEAEHLFLEDMRTERKQYCDEYVDRLWQKAKEKEEKRHQLLKKRAQNLEKGYEAEKARMRTSSWCEV